MAAQLIIPDARDWIGSYEAGKTARMTADRQQAQAQAGGLMASGDYAGAARAVLPYDLQAGSAIQNMGVQKAATQRQASYGAKLAAGQGDDAVKAAQGAGDFQIAGELQQQLDAADARQKAHVHDNATRLAEIVAPLGDISDIAQRKAYIAQHAGDLAGIYTPQQIQDFDPTDANLAHIYSQAIGLKDYLERTAPKVVGSALVRTPLVGKPEVLYEGDAYQVIPEGGKAIPKHGHVADDGSGGGAPDASGPTVAPTGGVYDQIGQIATQAGAQPSEVSYLQRNAQIESHGLPSAQNGRSTGVFQFHPDTFASLGGHNINDIGEQTKAALALSRRDRQGLAQIGVEPTDANLYIMHQQGPGGGRALLTAPPEVNAVAALTPVYGSADMAKRAIVGNGGNPDMTAGQFVSMWRQRWAGAGADRTAGKTAAGPGLNAQGDPIGTIYGSQKDAGDDSPMTEDAIKLQASKYLQTGVVPPFGMGPKGTASRNKFYNEAAKQAADLHLSAADLVSGSYTTKALGASLTQMEKSLEATQSYEQTALMNGDLMLKLAPMGGGQSNVPVLNRWLQAGRKQIAGDPNVTKFDNAIGAFSEEYAKVMTGNLGNVAATDGARKDAADRLSKYATQGQLQQGYAVMKQEMENRNRAQEAQVQGIQAKLRAGGGEVPAAPAPAAAPAPSPLPAQAAAQLKEGHVTTFANGQRWMLRNGQPVKVQ